MGGVLSIFLAGAIFSEYPVFLGKDSPIEAVIDRGPIAELIVKCPVGAAIFSYSKVDRQYCTPKARCFYDLKKAIDDSCR